MVVKSIVELLLEKLKHILMQELPMEKLRLLKRKDEQDENEV